MNFDKQRWIPVGLVVGVAVWCVWPETPRTKFEDAPKAIKLVKWDSRVEESTHSTAPLKSFFAAAYVAPPVKVIEGESVPPPEMAPMPFLNGNSLNDRLTLQGTGTVKDSDWAIINGKLYQTGDSIPLDNSNHLAATIHEIHANHVVMQVQGIVTTLPLALSKAMKTTSNTDAIPRSDVQ